MQEHGTSGPPNDADAADEPLAATLQRAILDSALDCVISMDEDGCITYFNPAAEHTFGYEADNVIGRELAEAIVPPSLREAHRRGLARYLQTGEVQMLNRRIGIRAMRADGTEFPAELTVTRHPLPGTPTFTGYLRDITERRRYEDLADEQAALRRVAELVARGAPSQQVFDAVCEETGRLIGATSVNLAHFTDDGMTLTMAGWSLHGNHVPSGTRLPLHGETIDDMVQATQQPSRVDSYDHVSGDLAGLLRHLGIKSEVGAPVVVDGINWGALIVSSDKADPFPDDTESRVSRFAALIATTVANASARSELIESRARVVAASDAARERVTRDLHDGAQQYLVNAAINLQLAQQAWSDKPGRAKELLDRAAHQTTLGLESLRELAAGIHPAILTTRGLAAALEALAATLPIPVECEVTGIRASGPVEASIYFFCAEALTNVVKHARAAIARVQVARDGDDLTVEVHDDGIGGVAMTSAGRGLTNLHDRISALNGTLDVRSPLAEGTTLRARIPLYSTSAQRE